MFLLLLLLRLLLLLDLCHLLLLLHLQLFNLLCQLSHGVYLNSRGLFRWHSWWSLSGCSFSWLLLFSLLLLPLRLLLLLLLSFLGLLSNSGCRLLCSSLLL